MAFKNEPNMSHAAQAAHAHDSGDRAAKMGYHDAAKQWYGKAAEHRALAARGVAGHHTDVPKAGGGGHGGNPNHDEHGRFA